MTERTARGLYLNRAGAVLGLLAFTCLARCDGQAATITLSWDPDSRRRVSEYHVYYGTASHNYSQRLTVANTNQASVSGLDPNTTYYFALTSVVGGQESDFSDEILFEPGSAAPQISLMSAADGTRTVTGTAPSGHSYDVLATTDFASWQAIGVVETGGDGAFTFADPAAHDYPARFYRLHETTYLSAADGPVLQIGPGAESRGRLSFSGQVGHEYDVLASTDLVNWKAIGMVLAGSAGVTTFNDPAATRMPARFYLLHDITYAGNLPSYKLLDVGNGRAVLRIVGLAGHTYQVLRTLDFINWSPIGTVALGLGGSALFTDIAGAGLIRFYGVREIEIY